MNYSEIKLKVTSPGVKRPVATRGAELDGAERGHFCCHSVQLDNTALNVGSFPF